MLEENKDYTVRSMTEEEVGNFYKMLNKQKPELIDMIFNSNTLPSDLLNKLKEIDNG